MLQQQAAKPAPSHPPAVGRERQPAATPALARDRWPELRGELGNQAAARRLQRRPADRGAAAAGVTAQATAASMQITPAVLPRISRAPLRLQRRCAACEAEEETRVQVGPAGDRYESEADTIAGHVMALRDGAASAAPTTNAAASTQIAPAALSRTSRAPSLLQRRCAACEAEEETRVQPRLQVGPAGDRYELEANTIAGHVMALRDGAVSPAPATNAAASTQIAPAVVSRTSRAPSLLQRRCAACEAETRVQPRLQVGPAGDRYELEADTIAGHVMALRGGDASPARATVQRLCSQCASSKDELRSRRIEPAVGKEDEHEGEARSADGGSGTQTLAVSEQQLTHGGAALSESTQRFFESRMGRDLSGVRVHIGGVAERLNDSIAARAFTYKNHIWLGDGEREAPTFTMAHELAHVMQQTAPGPVGPGVAYPPARAAVDPRIQRVPCDPEKDNLFFAPKKKAAEEAAEQDYVQWLTKTGGVLGEIPIPNGTKAKEGCDALGKFGIADLVKTDNGRFPGFGFKIAPGKTNPRPWFSPKPSDMSCTTPADMRLSPQRMEFTGIYDTSYFSGAKRSGKLASDTAPSWSGSAFINDATSAPTSIEIGEAKFGGTPNATTKAGPQIAHYLAGLKFAQRGYESIRQQIDRVDNELEAGKKPTLKEWKLKTAELTSMPGVPDIWTPVTGDDMQLIVAKWVRKSGIIPKGEREFEPRRCDETKETTGKFYSGHLGTEPVWLYAWYPNAAPPINLAGSAQFTGYRSTADRLLGEVTASPAHEPKPLRRLPLAHSPQASVVQPKFKPGKPFPKADPFQDKYAQWKADREALSKDFGSFEKTKQFATDTASLAFNRALTDTKKITGKSPNSLDPDTSAATKEAEKGLRHLELIAGPAGFVLGELRHRLGTFFLSIMGAYTTIKDKLAALFTQKPGGSGGNLTTRAIRAFTRGLGLVAAFLLPRVTDALIDCVKDGFRSTLESWIADTPLADVKAKFDSYFAEAQKIKDDVFGGVEKFVKDMFGPILKYYDEFKGIVQTAAKIIDLAKKAFDAARAAACLAGGLESAGISCVIAAVDKLLSLVGLSPSEKLMGWLIESCPAQKIFAEAMLAIGAVRDFPKTIAKKIVELVRPALPTQIQSFLCDPATMDKLEAEMPEIGDVTCGVGGSDKGGVSFSDAPPDPDRAALNRKPTDEEKKKFGGFDVDLKASIIPSGKPATPPPKPPPPVQAPAAPPPPPSGTGGTGRTHSIEPGTIGTGSGVGTVVVSWVIQGGFSKGKFAPPLKADAILSGTDSNGVIYGPDPIEILVYEVYTAGSKTGIKFEPAVDYKVISGGVTVQLSAHQVAEAELRGN